MIRVRLLQAGLFLSALVAARILLGDASVSFPRPKLLSETGLYVDLPKQQIAPANFSYSPQYPLWSDGAAKQRWFYLPDSGKIDASDPNNWKYPVGTKFWKEFSFGARVETRLIEKVAPERWEYATYVWRENGSDAELAPDRGLRNHAEIANGIRHDIPGVYDCKACHEGTGRDIVLGFNALQLSPVRDSLAPHAEPLLPNMITLTDLVNSGILINQPESAFDSPPVIRAATPRARASLGYLWSNCGGCHNAHDPLASVGMVLKLPLDTMFANRAVDLPTVIGHPSKYSIPGLPDGESYRVLPGDTTRSSLVYRMRSRNPVRQMPPLGTKIADEEAIHLISDWILTDLVREVSDKK